MKRSDLAADALGWLARCQQADGDLIGAIDTDGEAMARGGGRKGVAIYHGPLTLYLAGQTVEAVAAGARAAEMARASRDSEFAMYGLSHYALALGGIGRYDEANRIFEPGDGSVANTACSAAGTCHPRCRPACISLSSTWTREALQSEAREMAQSLLFTPTLVSASIDLLFTMARRHDPGRAERLLSGYTTCERVDTPGWHEWLWKLRLSQARAELALARDEFDLAVSEATAAVDQSQDMRPPQIRGAQSGDARPRASAIESHGRGDRRRARGGRSGPDNSRSGTATPGDRRPSQSRWIRRAGSRSAHAPRAHSLGAA